MRADALQQEKLQCRKGRRLVAAEAKQLEMKTYSGSSNQAVMKDNSLGQQEMSTCMGRLLALT